MSKNLFLVRYEDEDQDFYDDTAETLERVYLGEEIYEKIKPYFQEKKIFETKNSSDVVRINHIPSDSIEKIISEILIPECIRASEQLDKDIINNETEGKILLFGVLANILKLFIAKRDDYSNTSKVLIMVG